MPYLLIRHFHGQNISSDGGATQKHRGGCDKIQTYSPLLQAVILFDLPQL
jgi:hypothetical protein